MLVVHSVTALADRKSESDSDSEDLKLGAQGWFGPGRVYALPGE